MRKNNINENENVMFLFFSFKIQASYLKTQYVTLAQMFCVLDVTLGSLKINYLKWFPVG